MQITRQLSDDAVLKEIGRRLARTRLERNVTQAELGFEAGVGLNTIRRLEDGDPVKLPSLIRVLRHLDLLDALDVLIPEAMPSPIEHLKLRGRQRQRARHSRPTTQPSTAAWKWGDERPGDKP